MISIAEARNQLTVIIHQELTNGMQSRPDGWAELLKIRRELAEAGAFADWSDEEIRRWRDPSLGCLVNLE